MQLRLRTKLTVVMTMLVLLVVTLLSGLFLSRLIDQVIHETNQRASEWGQQVFLQAKHALADAREHGLRPASSTPEELHDYVRHAFEVHDGLQALLKAAIDSPSIYEVSITDHEGMVLIS